MNRLPAAQRAQILTMMVEGASLQGIARVTGASKNTVMKLLVDAGRACTDFQDKSLRGLSCKRLQVDEIWSFAYARDASLLKAKKGASHSVWTWTAIDPNTKLIPSFFVGGRDAYAANVFMRDLAGRLAKRVQLTRDGHKAYLDAVDHTSGEGIDYAILVEHYELGREWIVGRGYSAAECVGTTVDTVTDPPDSKNISTSSAERAKLAMRTGIRRFPGLTNAFSKKIENHFFALAIYFMDYNYCRIHQTIRITPAMAAGVSKTLWTMDDVVAMVEAWEASSEAA